MKRFFSIVFVISLLLSLGVYSFAEEGIVDTGTTTVTYSDPATYVLSVPASCELSKTKLTSAETLTVTDVHIPTGKHIAVKASTIGKFEGTEVPVKLYISPDVEIAQGADFAIFDEYGKLCEDLGSAGLRQSESSVRDFSIGITEDDIRTLGAGTFTASVVFQASVLDY